MKGVTLTIFWIPRVLKLAKTFSQTDQVHKVVKLTRGYVEQQNSKVFRKKLNFEAKN